MKSPRTVSIIAATCICTVLVFIAGFMFGKTVHSPSGSQSGGDTPCTMEAKLCPDGSAVGREGPNCNFPDCSDQPAARP